MFTPLQSSTNQELFEKRLCNQGSHYENKDDFHYTKEAITSRATTLFTVSKDEWNTKGDTGKSIKNDCMYAVCQKAHLVLK